MHTDKQAETRKPNYARKIGRIVLKSILFLMLFIVVVFLLVLTPPVQKFLTAKAENFLQNKLKTRVEIGGVSFGLSGRVHLKDIYLEDRTKDTLLSGGTIKANVTLLKLFSNEVEIKDVALENVTAKIKRVLPDTAFNFQFIVDAFVTENNKQTDTAQTAPLKLNVYNLDLTNINLVYQDVITGNDMRARIGNFTAKIDSLDLEKLHYSIPLIEASDITARIFQTKPLVSNPEPLSTDMAQAAEPITMKLNLGEIDLSKINLQYGNDISAFYTQLSLGELRTEGKNIDLQNQVLHLSELKLNNTTTAISIGNEQQAKALGKEIGQEVKAQTTQKSWSIRVDDLQLNNNDIRFDDNTKPRLAHGMDYAHLNGSGLTLHVKNLIFNSDSIGGQITRGSLREKSGFQLDALRADLLYAYNQSYIKDLYLKTPGTELKREVLLTYSSYQALADSFQKTQLEVDIPDSRIQVKDILVFAPQLRSQAAFSNPNDIWHLNINANGNMDRLHIAALEFEGLKNTVVDIEGTLASLTNPNAAGGTLTIRRLHTSQSDIALFTGQRLSNAQMNLPETFDLRGTVAGNMSKLNTNLILNTSAGGLAVVGRFGNLTNPKTATYNASIRTSGFKIGSILRNPQMGALSGSFAASGSGFTPDAMNARFRGSIFSFGFNNYTYRNVDLSGSLNRSNLTANVNSKDPNAFLNLTATGSLSNNPSFRVNGFIDSLKTLPLHFTAQPLIFRGKIDADIPTADPNNLEANVLITKALFVSGTNRLPLDTVQLVSGRSDTGQYIRLTSDVASAQLSGQYRLTDMGSIIQNTIQPYFSVTPYTPVASVQPYNISFTADLVYSPVLAAFVPGLKSLEPVHAEGRLATGQGMQAVVTSSHILFGTNEINDLNLKVNTA
ncbi:MAG TPA: hypothetical protein VER36_03050, partial [Flavisolibacter sp.]|nr:hypothetical protein [Flavisolibacter sp.]